MGLDRNFVRGALMHNGVKFAMHRLLDMFDNAARGTLAGSAGAFTFSSGSTDGASSVEPFSVNTVLTGAGAVGGRTRFELDADVALGAWANALKAQTQFGASGRVTGLASALVAELIMSAGCTEGTYGVLELELGMPENAVTGTATSFIHAVLYGDATAKGVVDDLGALINLSGVTEGDNHLFSAQGSVVEAEITHGLKVLVNGTPYYLLMATQAAFTS